MERTRSAIGGTMERFKKVLDAKGNRTVAWAVGGALCLFALFKLVL